MKLKQNKIQTDVKLFCITFISMFGQFKPLCFIYFSLVIFISICFIDTRTLLFLKFRDASIKNSLHCSLYLDEGKDC